MTVTQQVVVMSLVALTSSVSGWFFGSDLPEASANGKPIDETCVSKGENGDCAFYACFEQRLPCGRAGYVMKYGLPYCNKFQQAYKGFTPKGQEFVNGSEQCLAKTLLPFYRQPSVDCHDLSHAAFEAVSTCYAVHNFCDALKDNAALFADVYQPRQLFQTGAMKIWREILEVSYHCDPEQYHSLANKALNFLTRVINFFMD